jgi:integrase
VSDPYKRCGCTELVDGKRRQLGKGCPLLRRADGTWNPRHGTWTFAMSVAGKSGKRKQVVKGGYASKKEAAAARDVLRDRVRRGVTVEDVTVEVFLAEWLRTKQDIKRSTHRSYDIHCRKHLVPHLGHLILSELRVAHAADALAEVPGSDANRQRVRATLRSALSDAVRQGLAMVNVAGLVKLPSEKRPKAQVWTDERVIRWREAVARLEASDATGSDLEALEKAAMTPSAVMVWTPAQLGVFLDQAADDRLSAMLHVIAHRGLRRGEACGLRWVDIDLDAGTLTVSTQIVQLGWAPVEDDPKSDAGGRTIALDAGTVAVLRAHRKRQLEDRLEWGSAWVDSGRVFTREDGSELHPASITDRFHQISDAAGLPPIRLHDLRHGAASLMLAAGVDMKIVSETLGHSSLGITSDTYTSVFPQVAAAAAEATAAMVPRARSGTDNDTIHTHSHPGDGPKTGLTWSNGGPPGDRTPNPRISVLSLVPLVIDWRYPPWAAQTAHLLCSFLVISYGQLVLLIGGKCGVRSCSQHEGPAAPSRRPGCALPGRTPGGNILREPPAGYARLAPRWVVW